MIAHARRAGPRGSGSLTVAALTIAAVLGSASAPTQPGGVAPATADLLPATSNVLAPTFPAAPSPAAYRPGVALIGFVAAYQRLVNGRSSKQPAAESPHS